jgi:hypothetical protein
MTPRAPALVLLAALHAAGAQSTREVRLDAGAAQVQQAGRDVRDAAGIFGGSWRESSPVFATVLSAALISAADSVSAVQAALAAAWRASERSAWQTEGGTGVAAFGSSILSRGGSFSGFLRERRSFDWGGLWAGGADGGTTRDNIESHSTALDIGAWVRQGDFDLSTSVARLRSNDFALLVAAGIISPVLAGASAYDLTDATLEVRYEHGPILLDASESWRTGAQATSTSQSATYLSAIWTLTRRFALAVAAGRQLADPVRGVPDMQIASIALRVSVGPMQPSGAGIVMRASAYAKVTPRANGALMVVRVVADDSSSVEVAGTFSDWKPVPLTRTNDGWEVEIALPPGRHRVAVRLNDGPWRAPGGTARIQDDFGGEAGLVVVP